MSEAEKELQKNIESADGAGRDASRLRDELRSENKRELHSRNRNQ